MLDNTIKLTLCPPSHFCEIYWIYSAANNPFTVYQSSLDVLDILTKPSLCPPPHFCEINRILITFHDDVKNYPICQSNLFNS